MPLLTTADSPSTIAQSLTSSSTPSKPSYLIVYASHVNGRSWCGDCQEAEPLVERKFEGKDDVVTVVYAGLRDE